MFSTEVRIWVIPPTMRGTPGLEPGLSSCVLRWVRSWVAASTMKGTPGFEPGTCWSAVSRSNHWAMYPAMHLGLENSLLCFHERLVFLANSKDERGPGKSVWNVKRCHTHGFTCKVFHAWVHTLMQPQKEVCLAAIAPLRWTSGTKVQPPPHPCGNSSPQSSDRGPTPCPLGGGRSCCASRRLSSPCNMWHVISLIMHVCGMRHCLCWLPGGQLRLQERIWSWQASNLQSVAPRTNALSTIGHKTSCKTCFRPNHGQDSVWPAAWKSG